MDFMQRALTLAKQGEFSARPNPLVGCVIVNQQQIVGEGTHWQAGTLHAEQHALNQAGVKAKGATCYVTLEPCPHHGRTPPCVGALIEAGIQSVVIGARDPNPLVNGQGIQQLKQAGIEVQELSHPACQALNKGFFSRMIRKRPYVRAKIAMSMDGRIATSNGESQWITSDSARQHAQQWRAKSGAILTTHQTVKKDNCRLTVRHIPPLPKGVTFQQPLKVVVDSQLTTSPEQAIYQEGKTVVAFSVPTCVQSSANVEYVRFKEENQHVRLSDLLEWLAQQQINDVLIEAGSTLVGALLQADLIDEFIFYIAPTLLGHEAMPMAYCPPLALNQVKGQITDVQKIDTDLQVIMTLNE